MPSISAQAPGKVILVGEHAAVAGHRAVAAQIDWRVTTTARLATGERHHLASPAPEQATTQLAALIHDFDRFLRPGSAPTPALRLTVEGELPLGVGLGSSAALARALSMTVARWHEFSLTPKQLSELVSLSELRVHGRPSGIDAHAVIEGGVFEYRRGEQGITVSPLNATALNRFHFFLVQSGQPVESTKDMVDWVAAQPGSARLFSEIGAVVEQFISRFIAGEIWLEGLSENERLLEALGVVTPATQALIGKMAQAGLVAKVTGAGGRTNGSGMILVAAQDQAQAKTVFDQLGIIARPVRLGTQL